MSENHSVTTNPSNLTDFSVPQPVMSNPNLESHTIQNEDSIKSNVNTLSDQYGTYRSPFYSNFLLDHPNGNEGSYSNIQNRHAQVNVNMEAQKDFVKLSYHEYHHAERECTTRPKRNSLPTVLDGSMEGLRKDLKATLVTEDSQQDNSIIREEQNENSLNVVQKFNECPDDKKNSKPRLSIARLLEPTCKGIRSRIELLGELLSVEKSDTLPDVYDEMKCIIESTERNERLQHGDDGERLLQLTTAAKSNLNIDLYKLDMELQRQFGLYSVEVTGDGSCAFRAISISGFQTSDIFHSQLRDEVIEHVFNNESYYSTVLRPGERVTKEELRRWANAMTDPNMYADEMANIALSDLHHMQLAIFRAGELLTVINPRDGNVHHTAFLVNVGTHYKALVPCHQLEDARRNSERLNKLHT